ncbi:MAG TPA: IS110 family transposase [Calditrichia bacterium]|nr:IS110 family transposase [Calditrichota bacterium]HQU74009.1 IS110 family transposase [Calditrichia bacterium]HQV30697.1 IS110 family transposase [Calditrichia bacterium]
MNEVRQLDFANQHFYVGIDVHKKSWKVCLRKDQIELKTFSMSPQPQKLWDYMRQNYPNGVYHSVYEAGFCGFWIHRSLKALGFDNIVINPADVPTTAKEKDQKCDGIDARKLARELENQSLCAVYVPDEFHQQLRTLTRMRRRQAQQRTRLKNRIKSFLHINGIELDPAYDKRNWSPAFINWLKELEFSQPLARECLDIYLEDLNLQKCQIAKTIKQMRECSKQPALKKIIGELLMSAPGIGFIAAMTLYSEIVDMRRFPNGDALNAFVGLVPSISASGDRHQSRGLSKRCNSHLRYLLVEAAWKARRLDPALMMSYDSYLEQMPPQKAIIRIARKLLARIRHVWLTQRPYQSGIVE